MDRVICLFDDQLIKMQWLFGGGCVKGLITDTRDNPK